MKGTRRNHSRVTTRTTRDLHAVTFHGLQKWYKSKFEKLGWMILAKQQGIWTKSWNMRMALNASIKKIEGMRDKDKKDDLFIMKGNVETLLEHIKHDFE